MVKPRLIDYDKTTAWVTDLMMTMNSQNLDHFFLVKVRRLHFFSLAL